MCNHAQMEWNDLRYFLAVARQGRLLRVARTLEVDHTTVGRRISALEAALGAPLFQRTSKGWRLTRVGEQILPIAESIERETRTLTSTAYAAMARTTGVVRLAVVESIAVNIVTPHLPLLHARHPELQVELLTGFGRHDLTRGEADVAVRTPKPTQPDLSVQLLGDGAFGLYGLPELARRWQHAVDADRAHGMPLGVFTPEVELLQNAPWFGDLRRVANIRLRSASTLALIEYARLGQAIVPMPHVMASRVPELRRIGRRDVSQHKMWMVAHKEMRRDRRVAAVFQWARDVLAPLFAET